MSCCGSKRNDYVQQTYNASQPVGNHTPPKMWSDSYFEYTGETALTVIGSITRQRYHFKSKGDMQLIDYRDASGMMAVPTLQKVK